MLFKIYINIIYSLFLSVMNSEMADNDFVLLGIRDLYK
jgi:hypothetical protein